jgi:monoamine oxidase
MARSLYGSLHRRFGSRVSGAERARRAGEHYELVRSVLPLGLMRAPKQTGASPGSVAIVGAGFAGCAAAFLADRLGFDVTVYEASGRVGGRVRSSKTVVPGRILEEGAELIGLNHPFCIAAADHLGFALSVVTPEDDYAGAWLESPLILDGVSYDQQAQAQLYEGVQRVYDAWIQDSAVVTNPWAPWQTPNANGLDGENLSGHIPGGTAPDVVAFIRTDFELNNTTSVDYQSWLANLAQFQAGGGENFFDDTEVFRCAAGNQCLAVGLLGELPIVTETVSAIDTTAPEGVTITFADGGTAGPFDYVVVATSVAMWPSIGVDGGGFPYAGIDNGPAIKYLAPVETRFWIQELLAPSGIFDTLGMTWEGTDNQADTAGFDLTVFAGGAAAQAAIDHDGSDAYFAPLVRELYPDFPLTTRGTFVNWQAEPTIGTGYSCPGRGEVVGAQQSYTTPHNGRLFVAGEHTSPGWFGFMEGALESGIAAVARMAPLAGVELRDEWGGTTAL